MRTLRKDARQRKAYHAVQSVIVEGNGQEATNGINMRGKRKKADVEMEQQTDYKDPNTRAGKGKQVKCGCKLVARETQTVQLIVTNCILLAIF